MTNEEEPFFIPGLALTLMMVAVLPFVGLSIGLYFHSDNGTILLDLLFSYAALVLSFLGGIHWGMAVMHAQKDHPHAARLMYVGSIFTVAVSWGILFVPDMNNRLLSFAFLYAAAWGSDRLLLRYGIIPLWYYNLRSIATPIVVVSMYVAYFSIV